MHITNDGTQRTQDAGGIPKVKTAQPGTPTNQAMEKQRMSDQAHTSALSRLALREMRNNEQLNEVRDDKVSLFKSFADSDDPQLEDAVVDTIYTRMFSR